MVMIPFPKKRILLLSPPSSLEAPLTASKSRIVEIDSIKQMGSKIEFARIVIKPNILKAARALSSTTAVALNKAKAVSKTSRFLETTTNI